MFFDDGEKAQRWRSALTRCRMGLCDDNLAIRVVEIHSLADRDSSTPSHPHHDEEPEMGSTLICSKTLFRKIDPSGESGQFCSLPQSVFHRPVGNELLRFSVSIRQAFFQI